MALGQIKKKLDPPMKGGGWGKKSKFEFFSPHLYYHCSLEISIILISAIITPPSPFHPTYNLPSNPHPTTSHTFSGLLNPIPYGIFIPAVLREGGKPPPPPPPKSHIETFLEAYFSYEPSLIVFRQFPQFSV